MINVIKLRIFIKGGAEIVEHLFLTEKEPL